MKNSKHLSINLLKLVYWSGLLVLKWFWAHEQSCVTSLLSKSLPVALSLSITVSFYSPELTRLCQLVECFGRIGGSLLIEKHDGELGMEHLAGVMKACCDACSVLLVMKTLGSIKATEREEIFQDLQFE